MFAIVLIKGSQYKISQGDKVKIAKIDEKEGGKVVFYDVLLLAKDENSLKVGTPVIEGAAIEAKVLAHGKDKKIRVMKHHKRKRYIRTQGHRQQFTEIEISKIVESGAKREEPKKADPKAKKEPGDKEVEKVIKKETAPKTKKETSAKEVTKEEK